MFACVGRYSFVLVVDIFEKVKHGRFSSMIRLFAAGVQGATQVLTWLQAESARCCLCLAVGVISFVLVFISLPFIVINKKDRSKVII